MSEPRTEPALEGGLRLAVSLLTVLPVRAGRVDRESARWAMTLAPVAGLIVGVVAAVVLVVSGWLGFGPLLGAALIQFGNWRLIFWVMAGFAALLVVGGGAALPESRSAETAAES